MFSLFIKYHGFEGVLKSEEYLDVGGSMSKEDFLPKNVSAETYEKHRKAWVFLSQAHRLREISEKHFPGQVLARNSGMVLSQNHRKQDTAEERLQ